MPRKAPDIQTASTGDAFVGVVPEATQPAAAPAPRKRARTLPQPGDAEYDRIVQTNYGLRNGTRARLRALRDEEGLNYNEMVDKAVEAYIDAYEQEEGSLRVKLRHFD